MPYDQRPKNQCGRSGSDEEFSRKAPAGKFRVVAVDAVDGSTWVSGDFNIFQDALTHVDNRTYEQKMLKMYIYDDSGHCVGTGGTDK